MKITLGFLLGAVLAATLAFRSQAAACEYKIIPGEIDYAALNMQGSDGWELVAVTANSAGKPVWEFFKRCH